MAVTVMVCLVVAIMSSPWLVSLVTREPIDWRALADVGQAYGGISAILSALALCGIAASLVLQWRQARLADAATRRAQQIELVKVSLSDPDLAFPAMPGVPRNEMRRWMVLNLWVSHWVMLFRELATQAYRDAVNANSVQESIPDVPPTPDAR
ncbi:DUF6082 family protein [Actinoplanes sp. NPDC049596]|uniref:DUF6082 family protein n=1 Tax=unclassified Actinoplanes TaxID=2626549 RepID=UPI003425996E